jgi:hypothetical protein
MNKVYGLKYMSRDFFSDTVSASEDECEFVNRMKIHIMEDILRLDLFD